MSIEATPSTKWITKSDFRAWLTDEVAYEMPPSGRRGMNMQRSCACGCPIAIYLTHKHGGFWSVQAAYAQKYATFNQAIVRVTSSPVAAFRLPNWANAFIKRVDAGIYTGQLIIKPSEALAELR